MSGRILLLFDLDETVAPDEAVNVDVFDHVWGDLLGPQAERDSVFSEFDAFIQPLWQAGPAAEYCERLGISAWEGLWGPFGASGHPMLGLLHTFVPEYRADVWRRFVAERGLPGASTLRHELEARFLRERRARQHAYPWSAEVLGALATRFRLGMITNGAPDLQRLKLQGTGLSAYFDPLVVSGDLDVGKPERAIFERALALAAVEPEHAVMVGDSWSRDMLGALALGMRGIWVNPTALPLPDQSASMRLMAVHDLRDVSATLAEFGLLA